MNQYFLKPLKFLNLRRILALLLVAVLVLVQARVAFAGCVTPEADIAASVSAMDNCRGCSSTANSADLYDTLSHICGNHCSRSYVPPAQGPEILAIATVTLVNAETTASPGISPHIHAAHPGKSRLIYRLQRLLI